MKKILSTIGNVLLILVFVVAVSLFVITFVSSDAFNQAFFTVWGISLVVLLVAILVIVLVKRK